MGFNPFFHTPSFIQSKLAQNDLLTGNQEQILEIHYYGAGCSSEARRESIKQALAGFFPNAKSINVEHDMTGAVHATCDGKPGIVCILGTGSNSCYFNGETSYQAVPALGHLLGDEGSGSYFGRQILASFLRGLLPHEIAESIRNHFRMSEEEIYSLTYQQEHINVFLASFMKIVAEHENSPYIQEMVYKGIKEFARISIQCYESSQKVPVHFVGSIAYFFEDVLKQVALEMGFVVGKITRTPIEDLALRHVAESDYLGV